MSKPATTSSSTASAPAPAPAPQPVSGATKPFNYAAAAKAQVSQQPPTSSAVTPTSVSVASPRVGTSIPNGNAQLPNKPVGVSSASLFALASDLRRLDHLRQSRTGSSFLYGLSFSRAAANWSGRQTDSIRHARRGRGRWTSSRRQQWYSFDRCCSSGRLGCQDEQQRREHADERVYSCPRRDEGDGTGL